MYFFWIKLKKTTFNTSKNICNYEDNDLIKEGENMSRFTT